MTNYSKLVIIYSVFNLLLQPSFDLFIFIFFFLFLHFILTVGRTDICFTQISISVREHPITLDYADHEIL